MSVESTRIVLQRQKATGWMDWDWITLGRDKPEEKQIRWLRSWIKQQAGDGNTYRIVRIVKTIEII